MNAGTYVGLRAVGPLTALVSLPMLAVLRGWVFVARGLAPVVSLENALRG